MHKLIVRLSTASLCFLIGVIASYPYPAHTGVSRPPETRVVQLSETAPAGEAEGHPGRGRAPVLDESVLDRVARAVSGSKRGVRFTPAFCTCPGIIPDQKSYRYGILKRGDRFVADAYIAEAASVEAAAKAMSTQHNGREGWQAYALGDEAYLLRGRGGRSGGISLRVGNIVVQVSGMDEDVLLLAACIADALSAS